MQSSTTRRPAALSIAALLIAALCFATSASAATLTVCASGCDYNSIDDAVAASSPGDALELEPETFTEGNIIIDHDLTVRTSSGFATIDAAGANYVFKVLEDNWVTIENITLKGANSAMLVNNGRTKLKTVRVFGNSFATTYGGILNNAIGTLLLTDNSQVSGNVSNNFGGGISNFGDLTIDNSTISGNRGRYGGAVLNRGGQTSVRTSSFSGNHATQWGGAWANGQTNGRIGSLTFHNSASVAQNTATQCAKYRNGPTGECVD